MALLTHAIQEFPPAGPNRAVGRREALDVTDGRSRHSQRWGLVASAAAGILAAGVGLGVAELVAGLVGPRTSPVLAVGDVAITLTPEWLKELAISHFGTHDKTALLVGIGVVITLYAAAVGLLSRVRLALGVAGVLLFGGLGVAAAISRPEAPSLAWLPASVAALVAVAALVILSRPLRQHAGGAVRESDSAAGEHAQVDRPQLDRAELDRRGFLTAAAATAGVAVVSAVGGRLLQSRADVASARKALVLPEPASPAMPIPPAADVSERIPGITPLVTPNSNFYRVDTALSLPQVAPEDYELTLRGRFAKPRSYRLEDLLGRDDLIERVITLTCVSNVVGGDLAGTATWLGVPLAALLRENGIDESSTQLVCRSVDGMTIGASTRAALTTPDAMLAVGMNGKPLPVAHGFPVRMIIPGIYGYASACKWLTSIEATTFDAYDAYWVKRGYKAVAPIKVSSRIDTPAPLRTFRAGPKPIAGVAWAQTHGIRRVEVQIDDGPWQEAELAPQVSVDVWRQWYLSHDFEPGQHQITVRATDGDGHRQTQERTGVYPDGATGWHSIRVIAT